MTWTHDPTTNTLSHASGFVIRFEPITRAFASKPWDPNSVVVEYQGRRWRGTREREPRSQSDTHRLMREAHDEFLRVLRARVNPFPDD